MKDLVYWIWLSLACTPSLSTFPKLLCAFDSARAVYEADEKAISRAIGFNNSDRSSLYDKELEKAQEVLAFCEKHQVGILTYPDEKYPTSLREIDSPPVLLYYRGVLPDFSDGFYVAAVGTRSLTDYGRKNSFKICYDLAKAGARIVSGMAIGIDGVCHAAALSADGITVAVLGSGIDVCYPLQHKTLARAIVKNGCVLTEYAPGTPPNKLNFPRRNRIISGLCAATIVFEGRERSGALITARYAKDQGRVLYALPGNVGEKHSEVSNLLIKNGAKICMSADDVVDDFSSAYGTKLNPFLMPKEFKVNILDSLSSFGVVAVCHGDNYFIPTRSKKIKEEKTLVEVQDQSITKSETEAVEPPQNFDKSALKIYKKIPLSGECSLESLVDDEMGLRDVMKALLKLEMNRLIVILPGERVTRKTK